MATTSINLKTLKKVVYNSPSQNFNEVEPNIVQFGSAAVWAKPFTLTAPALPMGVSSFTIRRVSTQTSYAETGIIISGNTTTQNTEIYYGDVLSISATAAEHYNEPTATLSQNTVTGDVIATITSGQYIPYWHTIWSGNSTLSVLAFGDVIGGSDTDTLTVSGLTTTRDIRFSGNMTWSAGFEEQHSLWTVTPISSIGGTRVFIYNNADSFHIGGVVDATLTLPTGEEYELSAEADINLSFGNGQVELSTIIGNMSYPSEVEGLVQSATIRSSAGCTITKIEQYY